VTRCRPGAAIGTGPITSGPRGEPGADNRQTPCAPLAVIDGGQVSGLRSLRPFDVSKKPRGWAARVLESQAAIALVTIGDSSVAEPARRLVAC